MPRHAFGCMRKVTLPLLSPDAVVAVARIEAPRGIFALCELR